MPKLEVYRLDQAEIALPPNNTASEKASIYFSNILASILASIFAFLRMTTKLHC